MALHLKPELLCFQFLCSVSIKLTYFLFSLNVNAYDWSNDIVLLLNRTKIRAPHWLLQRITYLDNCVVVFYTLLLLSWRPFKLRLWPEARSSRRKSGWRSTSSVNRSMRPTTNFQAKAQSIFRPSSRRRQSSQEASHRPTFWREMRQKT